MESNFFSPCSCSDPPFSHQGVALTHLDSLPPHNLVICKDGSFPFGKGGSCILVNCSVALRPFFPSQQAQYVQVFALKLVPFCTLFAGLRSSNKSATSLFFYYLTPILFSPPSYLKLYGKTGSNCLLSFSVLSGYNGSLDTCFSQQTTWLMSWPDGECYLHPMQSLVVSPLSSRIHFCLFSVWRCTLI